MGWDWMGVCLSRLDRGLVWVDWIRGLGWIEGFFLLGGICLWAVLVRWGFGRWRFSDGDGNGGVLFPFREGG
jgi:hypothetical protein